MDSPPSDQHKHSFPKTSRLLKANDYDQVFKQPDARFSNSYILLLCRASKTPIARLGLVVGKKKIPLAVNRNRFKRLIRERFRLRKTLFQGMDIVVLARGDLSGLDKTRQQQKIAEIFNQLEKRFHGMTFDEENSSPY